MRDRYPHIPVYVGRHYGQRGAGLGNIFGSLAKIALPLLKKTGRLIAKEGARTAAGVLADVAGGSNAMTSFKKRGRDMLINSADGLINSLHRRPSKKRRHTKHSRNRNRKRSRFEI